MATKKQVVESAKAALAAPVVIRIIKLEELKGRGMFYSYTIDNSVLLQDYESHFLKGLGLMLAAKKPVSIIHGSGNVPL